VCVFRVCVCLIFGIFTFVFVCSCVNCEPFVELYSTKEQMLLFFNEDVFDKFFNMFVFAKF